MESAITSEMATVPKDNFQRALGEFCRNVRSIMSMAIQCDQDANTRWLQMMFVSGETAEIPVETTNILEEIVHEQVIEIVRVSTNGMSPS